MARYVYACVHDGQGNFLIGVKNQRSAFYLNRGVETCFRNYPAPSVGAPYGAGLYALPGGGLNQNENITAGAQREFLQETNVDLSRYRGQSAEHNWNPLGSTHSYHALLLQLSTDDFFDVLERCIHNIALANIRAVQLSRTMTHDRAPGPAGVPPVAGTPEDNELMAMTRLNKNDDAQFIISWPNSLNWYKDIIRAIP